MSPRSACRRGDCRRPRRRPGARRQALPPLGRRAAGRRRLASAGVAARAAGRPSWACARRFTGWHRRVLDSPMLRFSTSWSAATSDCSTGDVEALVAACAARTSCVWTSSRTGGALLDSPWVRECVAVARAAVHDRGAYRRAHAAWPIARVGPAAVPGRRRRRDHRRVRRRSTATSTCRSSTGSWSPADAGGRSSIPRASALTAALLAAIAARAGSPRRGCRRSTSPRRTMPS